MNCPAHGQLREDPQVPYTASISSFWPDSGLGKNTACAKLALYYRKQVTADAYRGDTPPGRRNRPAETLGKSLGVSGLRNRSPRPFEICKKGLQQATRDGISLAINRHGGPVAYRCRDDDKKKLQESRPTRSFSWPTR